MYDTVIRPFVPPDQQAARVLILRGLGEHFGWIDETCNPDLDDIAATYTGAGHLFLGVERALVAQLVQAAREHGIERVIVETNADWDDAIGLYQRCGFTIRERRDGGVLLALELA